MFMDAIAAMFILIPVLLPPGFRWGSTRCTSSIVTVITLTLGLVTPPVGVCLFAAAQVAQMRIEDVIRGIPGADGDPDAGDLGAGAVPGPDARSDPAARALLMFAGTVVVMGVSGTGKTEVAARLATELGRAFIEADRLHGPAKIAKMASGAGLTDDDRGPGWPPWRRRCVPSLASRDRLLCAWSVYRDFSWKLVGLSICLPRRAEVGDPGAMEAGQGHFAKASLLEGQLAALETPVPDEDFLRRTSGIS